MGIPAICGLGDSLKPEYQGRMSYIDGETGQAALDPDELTLAAFQTRQQKQEEMKELLQTMKGQEDVTLDGRKMMVYCNIGSPEDVAAVLANDGQGIRLGGQGVQTRLSEGHGRAGRRGHPLQQEHGDRHHD